MLLQELLLQPRHGHPGERDMITTSAKDERIWDYISDDEKERVFRHIKNFSKKERRAIIDLLRLYDELKS
jgi:hypothetical protein